MNDWLIKLIEIHMTLIGLSALYTLLLKNSPLLKLRRSFLLIAVPISIVLPFLRNIASLNSPISITLPPLEITANAQISSQISSFPWAIFYLTGCLISLVLFGTALWRINHFIQNSEKTRLDQFILIIPQNKLDVSSFGRYIFWNNMTEAQDAGYVMAHEKAHILQHHTLDILFLRLAAVFLWCNPAIYLLLREIKLVHEHLADRAALTHPEEKILYQKILLGQAMGTNSMVFAHSFHSKFIKNRIAMLSRKIKSIDRVKGLSALVLLSLFSVTIACTKMDSNPANNGNKILETAKVMPSFPGGKYALAHYLGGHIKYPESAKTDSVQGRVYIGFVINSLGQVEDAHVLRSPDDRLTQAALEVVKGMPNWNPGKENGKPVNVQYTLPINFQLR